MSDFSDSPVYYRVYNSHNGPCVVTMQWFDEHDYNQSDFLSDEKFDTEEKAEAFLNRYLVQAMRALGILARA